MSPTLITDPAMSALDVVIAHQGWDELLLFGAPVVLAILSVRWAERRSKSRQDDEPADPDPADPDAPAAIDVDEQTPEAYPDSADRPDSTGRPDSTDRPDSADSPGSADSPDSADRAATDGPDAGRPPLTP